jgi:hypothetical protein
MKSGRVGCNPTVCSGWESGGVATPSDRTGFPSAATAPPPGARDHEPQLEGQRGGLGPGNEQDQETGVDRIACRVGGRADSILPDGSSQGDEKVDETKPSMGGPMSSEAVQILCRGVPTHPLRRRLRSIWPISDRSSDDRVVHPAAHPLSLRPREITPPRHGRCTKRRPT